MTGVDPLLELLADCVVPIERDGRFEGTGFWVAPGELLTCAHVVHGGKPITVQVGSQSLPAEPASPLLAPDDPAAKFYPQPDVALLRVTDAPAGHPCVLLDPTIPTVGPDLLQLAAWTIGENAPGRVARSGATLHLETSFLQDGVELFKLREGQVVGGFSGGPLLNRRTGGVCALVDSSRSVKTDLGGFGVPVALIEKHLPGLLARHAAFHDTDLRWTLAVEQQRVIEAQRAGDSAGLPLLPPVVELDWTTDESPSELLRARYAVVPFVPRGDLLEQVMRWREADAGLSLLVLTGAGGFGKTRTAVEICRAAAEAGWTAGHLTADPDTGSGGVDGLDDLLRWPGRLLVAVDYAETRPDLVARLLTRLRRRVAATRVVLVVRQGGGRDALIGLFAIGDAADDLARLLRRAELVGLGPGERELDRQVLFQAAAGRFTVLLGRVPEPTPDLYAEHFARPLFVVAAALLAVANPELDVSALTAELLLSEVLDRHEAHYWRRTASRRGLNLDDEDRPVAAALTALCGLHDPPGGDDPGDTGLLRLVPALRAADDTFVLRTVRWLRDLYGPTGILEPDLLAEVLITRVLRTTPPLAATVLDAVGDHRLGRALVILSRIVARSDPLRELVRNLLDDRLPDLIGRLRTTTNPDLVVAMQLVVTETQPVAGAIRAQYAIQEIRSAADGRLAIEICRLAIDGLETAVAQDPEQVRPQLADALTLLSDAYAASGARQTATVHLMRAIDVDSAPLREPADPLDPRRLRLVTMAAKLHNLAKSTGDAAAMDRVRKRLQPAVAPFRIPDPSHTPDQAVLAGQMVALADALDQDVLGLAYRGVDARERGDHDAAASLFDRAEAQARRGPADEAGMYLAFVLAYRRRYAEAAAVYRSWLHDELAAIGASDGPDASTMARTRERQRRDQALAFAVRVRDPGFAREQLAVLQAQADPWWADLGSAWEHDATLGELHELEDDLDGAAAAFTRAVDGVEQVRTELRHDDLRQAFGAGRTVQQVYRDAARVALRREEGLEAVRLLELARSRALTNLMTAPRPGLDQATVDAWRGAGAEVALAQNRLAAALAAPSSDPQRAAARRAELTAAQDALTAREADLRALDPRFWDLATASATELDPAALLAGLPPGHAVLMYSMDRSDLVMCGLTAGGVVASGWSQEERRVKRLARNLVDACADGRAAWRPPAAALAEILLDPLAAALDTAHTVHVVASGATQRVPFAVLPWQGRPLGEQVTLTVLPNLAALSLAAARTEPGTALCVGNPSRMTWAGAPMRNLPAAAVEAAAVARTLDARPLLGSAATEERVRTVLPAARTVHLATHGVVDPESPLASAVLLADGEQLTVAELVAIRLTAQLVVLSACQTGTGAVSGGDELLDMGRALLAAGAQAVVVTLWPVDDVSAALVMSRFHALRAELPTGQALRAATAWLAALTAEDARTASDRLRAQVGDDPVQAAIAGPLTISTLAPTVASYAHPYHWAPYVLIGR